MESIPKWVWRLTTGVLVVLLLPFVAVYYEFVMTYSDAYLRTTRNQTLAAEATAQGIAEGIRASYSITAYDSLKDAMEGTGATSFLAWRAQQDKLAAPAVQPFDTKSTEKSLPTVALKGSKS